MSKIKTYKNFENHIVTDENYFPSEVDVNYEEKMDAVMQSLLKRRQLVSLLSDTIEHVCGEIEKSLPPDLESFMEDLRHYDDEIFEAVDEIKEKMIDGYNMKDMIEEVVHDFILIENYMKLKND